MKKALRDRWVQELRSGRHTQITGHLDMGPGRYCALGVLARCASGKAHHLTPNDYGRASNMHPHELSKVVTMNDYHMLPFTEIADWIEQHIPVEEECPVRKHHHHSERSHA